MPFRLRVPEDVLAALVAHALAEKPNECCGFLAGVLETREMPDGTPVRVGRVVERFPLVNAAADPKRYDAAPASLFAATHAMRARGLRELAVYHSHPTSEPVPSRTDLALNYSEEVVSLIVSLTTTPPTVRGWWLTERSYREAEWDVAADLV